jgi:hypothetical protein
LGKRRRRFATRHTHSLRSDRAFRSIVPPSRAARPTERPKRALPYRQSMEWGTSGRGFRDRGQPQVLSLRAM